MQQEPLACVSAMESIDCESGGRYRRDECQKINFSVGDDEGACYDEIVVVRLNHLPFLHGSRLI